jgi:signal transduction histidine kinase
VTRFTTLSARLRGLDPYQADLLAGAALGLLSMLWVLARVGQIDHPVLAALLNGAAGTSVAWRRRAPVLAAAGALLAVAAFEWLAYVDNWIFPALAILLNGYSVAAYTEGRKFLLALPLTLGFVWMAVAIDPSSQKPGDFLFTFIVFWLVPIAAGRTLRNRRALTVELAAKAARLEREREEQAREAVTDERARIARDLHDVVAHGVSVMVIQAAAARRVAGTDREAARGAMGAARSAGRDALVEMRRMVGVLRRGDEELDGSGPPGLGALGALAARARSAGLPVELRVEGEPGPLSSGADIAAYRVVPEALTNALKHAGPAHARVAVRYLGDGVDIEVSDTGAGPGGARASLGGGGHGLVGMRERVALYGGRVEAGRKRGGGFAVRAHIPMEKVPA